MIGICQCKIFSCTPTPTAVPPTITPTPTATPSPLQCPLVSGQIVEFGDGFIQSNLLLSDALIGPIPIDLDDGVYRVTLVSYDNHDSGQDHQPNERYYLAIKDEDGKRIATTNSISDLPSNVNQLIETVNEHLVIDDEGAWVYAVHSAYPDSNSNSLHPVCASFEEIE
ncbi:MAG: hypothetical protein GY803_25430 [Chloroflexi bacterium]|nr:hypothetical protein [Chloroflexota bacterium]